MFNVITYNPIDSTSTIVDKFPSEIQAKNFVAYLISKHMVLEENIKIVRTGRDKKRHKK